MKTVILGVTGGIAAYKSADLVSRLKKAGYNVHVLMTENATRFISPITFETLSGNSVITDTFDRTRPDRVEHIALAKEADLFMIAPASADVIAKVANGLADDMLTSSFLAAECPKFISPAMNTAMYNNPVTQHNLKKLDLFGVHIIEPAIGRLACGDSGAGKMPSPSYLVKVVDHEIALPKDMRDMHVLVTCGATMEAIDPVRYITNHSSGRMGYAMARECMLRGADVIIVKGNTTAEPPEFCRMIDVKNAEQMYDEVIKCSKGADIVIMAAAVSDYTPETFAKHKLKKQVGDMDIKLKRTQDILATLGNDKASNLFLCGFSMETQNLIGNSQVKLKKKNADMIVANNLNDSGAGFGTDTNLVTLITENGVEPLDLMSKEEVAHCVINRIVEGKVKASL